MVVELSNYTNGAYKSAKCVKLWISPNTHQVYLIAEWNTPPTGYGSRYRSIATSSSLYELKIWWEMQNEDIPFLEDDVKFSYYDIATSLIDD